MSQKANELIKAQEEYIKLLGEELSELQIMAAIRGWKSSRIEQGQEGRDKIDDAKAMLKLSGWDFE